ncbi:MAG: glycoside hydrolase family 3 C-terminal domain-containing protein [Bacteroidales bacterium]|nr:glycoside hydrolase family 3 C-terminal domain-containing protein [Bacteroidales bacterium]
MKKLVAILLILASLGAKAQVQITPADKERASALVKQMTLEEKCRFIAGARSFYTVAIPRLGIPEIRMADGPQGVRNNTVSTQFPCGILTAATWNRDLAHRLGNSLADDCRARGVSILLGPGVNIYRAPMCGRNFEYFGEDPYLSGETAVHYILGVQEKGVMATVKHFAANNQEKARHTMSSDVDERTLQEIYFPAFRKAVQEGGVGAIMDSYNLVNSVHSTENAWMNKVVLRDQWGFEGIVMSDWTSVYSTIGAVNGGLDLECPKGVFFTPEKIMPLIGNGVLQESAIDEKVQHILQTFIAFGFLDKPQKDDSIPENNPASAATALDIAREGIVLLKNDNTLPFTKKSKILVVGANGIKMPHGGGSGEVTPFYTISVADGLTALHKKVTVIEDKSLLEKEMASCTDIVYCCGFNRDLEGEAFDRPFSLTEKQLELMERIQKNLTARQHLTVVINSGGAVDMAPWMQGAHAILMAWYPGQEGGTAVAEILTGKVSPSGKLPISMEAAPEDNPSFATYFDKDSKQSRTSYSEGIFTGYRGYDKTGVKPLYPFGFGLSYSTFKYSNLTVEKHPDGKVEVSFDVTNTGKRDAAEVGQVYVRDISCSVPRPLKELKGYDKHFIGKGKTVRFSAVLDSDAFTFYSTASHSFVLEGGEFEILAGPSSADLPLKATIVL